MKSVILEERPNYRDIAMAEGFTFPDMYGQKYWDETHAYKLTLAQIENDIEDPTNELVKMCYEAVDFVVNNPQYLTALQIPAEYHDAIRESWEKGDKDIYGRFDLSYDGNSPAKMLEFNADTPTSLYESAVFQWQWLQDMVTSGQLSEDVDQFNSIHEKLVESFKKIKGSSGFKIGNPVKNMFSSNNTFHFAAVLESPEDALTVGYMADCAYQAGFSVNVMDVENIGVDADTGMFYDENDRPISKLFKLYPLETMFREEFGPYLKSRKTAIYEPLWKSVLSNKGILAVLWKLYPDHPNLLPSYLTTIDSEEIILHCDKKLTSGGYVKKPIFSREGANVEIHAPGIDIVTDGEYGEEGHVIQAFHPLPKFGDSYAVIGSWVVAGEAAGIGIREDSTLVTRNLSRFIPHFIEG